MEIRDAKPSESGEIYSIMRGPGRIAYTEDLVRDLMSSKHSMCLVLSDDGEIIGSLGARGEGRNSFWLYYVVVKEGHRGKGHAARLMEEMFARARKVGVKRIALDTPDKAFFERFGFREVGRLPDWYEDGDQVIMYQKIE